MQPLEQLEGDLRFLRRAVESDHRSHAPAAIYVLWAVAVVIGFALVDFRHSWVPGYWTIVGPAGFAASTYLSWRHARRAGRVSAFEGQQHVLHWGGTLVAILLAMLMPYVGAVPWDSINALILLVLALAYFTAGVHLDRSVVWVGVLLAAGYIGVALNLAYAWTVVGVVVAAALLMAGRRREPSREAAT